MDPRNAGVFKQVGDVVECYEHGATKPYAKLRRVKDKSGREVLEVIEADSPSRIAEMQARNPDAIKAP